MERVEPEERESAVRKERNLMEEKGRIEELEKELARVKELALDLESRKEKAKDEGISDPSPLLLDIPSFELDTFFNQADSIRALQEKIDRLEKGAATALEMGKNTDAAHFEAICKDTTTLQYPLFVETRSDRKTEVDKQRMKAIALNTKSLTFEIGGSTSLEDFVTLYNAQVSSIARITEAEYCVGLYASLSTSAKSLLIGTVDRPAEQTICRLHYILSVYLSSPKSETSRKKEFWEFKPSNKQCRVQELLSEVGRLGAAARVSNRDIYNKIVDILPLEAQSILTQALSRHQTIHADTNAYPDSLQMLSSLVPHLERFNEQLADKHKAKRPERVNLVSGGQCVICQDERHDTSRCWFNMKGSNAQKNRIICILCSGAHLGPQCEVYKGQAPTRDACPTCKSLLGRDLYHSTNACKVAKN